MSESRIDKLKRAAVGSKSLGGRYDPAPHTDFCEWGGRGGVQGNLLLNEGDNHPLIF